MFETYRSLSDPFAGIDITLWLINVIILFSIAFFTLYRIYVKKPEMRELQRSNAITWAISFILFGIANFLNIIWRYTIENEKLATDFDNLSVLLINIAVFIKVLHTEYMINKYRFYKGYYFSFIALGLTIFTTIVTPELVREVSVYQVIYLILLILGISIFPLMFLYLTIKLNGRERLIVLKIFFALLLLFIGLLLEPQNLEGYKNKVEMFDFFYNTFLILSPILVSIAILILFDSYRKNLQIIYNEKE
ncbi:MAG: hypothetical protein ACTSQJ_08845 [Promethearchaeota archaeon]